MNQLATLTLLNQLADNIAGIEVMWLYGSRVKGTATASSDYDLAMALVNIPQHSDYLDELAYLWSIEAQQEISIVDINHIPTPLAYNIINEGEVITCKNSLRLHAEQARVWSLWEAYRYEYIKNKA